MKERRLHRLVERQAADRPSDLALVSGTQTITYGELNSRANEIARWLRTQIHVPETVIGIMMPRSIDFIVCALAIWKAGAAYLPLDPGYPVDRLNYMVEDASASHVLTQAKYVGVLTSDVATLCLDLESDRIETQAGANLDIDCGFEDLSYVVYTSGSSGRPKGVEVVHRGVSNMVSWYMETFGYTTADRVTHLASVGFDAAVLEIWPALAAGATVYLPDDEVRLTPAKLQQWIVNEGISVAWVPTIICEELITMSWPSNAALRFLTTGGDKLQNWPVETLTFQVVNLYGPTENSVITTYAILNPAGKDRTTAPPIGRPISNVKVYVLDEGMEPVPVGVSGSLFIGGIGLFRGYRNHPELSEQVFVESPFSRRGSDLLYRTGDIVRYRVDGELEYIGRNDNQLEIRGYRIDPEEIEVALSSHPAIKQSVVVAQGAGLRRTLVGYVLVEPHLELGSDELRLFLRNTLPDYMIPSVIHQCETFPLSPNGKVDRSTLSASHIEGPSITPADVPITPLENLIAQVWSDVLERSPIGPEDSFFALGGHSLLAVQVANRLSKLLHLNISLVAIMRFKTLRELAHHIEVELLDGRSEYVETKIK